jgi:hypothetical protein
MGVRVPSVFLSYASRDHIFAELARLKLEEAGIGVWVDRGQLRAGDDWRQGIDQGISESFALLLALSSESSGSPYVTYEWASAIGRGKPIVPLLLEKCTRHPKLEPIQYLDFSVPGHLPWSELIERISEIEQDDEVVPLETETAPAGTGDPHGPTVEKILAYLNQRGYQMVSFDRVRRRIDEGLTDDRLRAIIRSHPSVFRPARLKGEKPGLAKL